jgi:putative DeoR family transcriptional regulator (stage III sporulation protein D)
LKSHIRERVLNSAQHILETEGTIRSTAEAVGVSKSTTHVDLSYRLWYVDINKAIEVKRLLAKNKAERSIRGGRAYKRKCEEAKVLEQSENM